MRYAVLHGLRSRSNEINVNWEQTPNGHRISPVILNRLVQLKRDNDLHPEVLIDECNAVIELVTEAYKAPKKAPTAPKTPKKVPTKKIDETFETFDPAFVSFVSTGDISPLAPNGFMSKEMFERTQDYIFCHIKSIKGKSVNAVFHSNQNKFCGGFCALPDLEEGPAIIIRRNGIILNFIQPVNDFNDLARTFNSTAARSK